MPIPRNFGAKLLDPTPSVALAKTMNYCSLYFRDYHPLTTIVFENSYDKILFPLRNLIEKAIKKETLREGRFSSIVNKNTSM